MTMHGERLVFDSYGLRIAVTLPNASFIPSLEAALPPVWEPAPDERVDHDLRLEELDAAHSPIGRSGWFLAVDGTFEWSPKSLDGVAMVLEDAIERCLTVNSPAFVFVHAGTVVWNNRAMLFPGHSHSGKSSLVAALVDQGATYYSDEYAVIGADGLIYPYARRMSLRDADGGTRRVVVPSGGEGLPFAKRGVPPGLAAALRYEQGSVSDRIETVTPEEIFGVLLQHTHGIRMRPAQVMEAIGTLADQVEGCVGPRGEAAITASRLLGLGGHPPLGIIRRDRDKNGLVE